MSLGGKEGEEIVRLLADQVGVLHGGLGGPSVSEAESGGDLDVAVRGLDPWWALRLPSRYRLCQNIHYDVTGRFWIITEGARAAAIDTLDDPKGIGRYGIPVHVNGLGDSGEVPPGLRAAYLALKRIRKGTESEAEWRRIGELGRSDSEGLRSALGSALGKGLGDRLTWALLKDSVPDLGLRGRVRTIQTLRRFLGPMRAFETSSRMLARLTERVLHPTGLWVTVVGSDGSGKSSLAAVLPAGCSGLFRRDRHLHWRPGVLPRPGALIGAEWGDVTEPHSRPPHSALVSLSLLVYFWVDFALGSVLRVSPMRIRTGLVVMERGWWDMAVDPLRYRLRIPQAVVRVLGSILPKPDLVLILDAPALIAHERKAELPPKEIERQRRAWLALSFSKKPERVVIDASRSRADVAVAAREAVLSHLERRVVQRLGWGWAGLPRRAAPRFWLPRGPRWVACRSPSMYQPVTPIGRLGWTAARLVARAGAFRLLPRAEGPPREVREILAAVLPAHSSFALMRATHPGRYVALLLRDDGTTFALAKVATTEDGRKALSREAQTLEELGTSLNGRVRAPRLLDISDGLILLEMVQWLPRARPWKLPAEVAASLGKLWRETGRVHGDAAPWNLLVDLDGWVLVDWEASREEHSPFWDVWHYIVQSHALLGQPTRQSILQGLRDEGPVSVALAEYAREARIDRGRASSSLQDYLQSSETAIDSSRPEGLRGLRARRQLLNAFEMSR